MFIKIRPVALALALSPILINPITIQSQQLHGSISIKSNVIEIEPWQLLRKNIQDVFEMFQLEQSKCLEKYEHIKQCTQERPAHLTFLRNSKRLASAHLTELVCTYFT